MEVSGVAEWLLFHGMHLLSNSDEVLVLSESAFRSVNIFEVWSERGLVFLRAN